MVIKPACRGYEFHRQAAAGGAVLGTLELPQQQPVSSMLQMAGKFLGVLNAHQIEPKKFQFFSCG